MQKRTLAKLEVSSLGLGLGLGLGCMGIHQKSSPSSPSTQDYNPRFDG